METAPSALPLRRLAQVLAGSILAASTAFAAGSTPQVSPDGVWRAMGSQLRTRTRLRLPVAVRKYRLFRADRARLSDALGGGAATTLAPSGAAAIVLTLPMPDGSYARITVREDSILGPDLQAAYPDIKTYSGEGLDDPTMTAVLDQTVLGFHGQILGERGTVIVDPVDREAGVYMSFWKHDAVPSPFHCFVDGSDADPLRAARSALLDAVPVPLNPSGGTRRTYRLRMTTTDAYTNFFGGRTQAAAAVTTTINRVRGIYEREVSESFTLISIDALLLTDMGYPFANPVVVNGAFLDANNNFLNGKYGSGTYDIGHVVGAGGGGGLAGLAVVCGGSKGRGGTQTGTPMGDAFDVDYVAHEMGHQMGGDHTFNGVTSNCGGGNRVASSAYEPGSGTTIMAYAGICGVDDVQPHSDDYFHTRSFDQIIAVRDSAGCGTLTDPTGNNPPNVSAGADYTIPQNTPFTLTASGSDPDGQAITFNWEEFDLGAAASHPLATDTAAPLFRSRPSTSSASRTFPPFADVLSGTSPTFEVLPQVDRDIHFRVTARDNIGGVRYDDMTVHASGNPFRLTAPAGGSQVECGLPTTISWDVGGGSVASDVRVDFSSNDGASFSTIVGSTPNDGSEALTLPKSVGFNRRMMLAGIGNIFFSVSRPFRIADTLAPAITPPAPLSVECTQKSPQGATPNIGTATAADACDAFVPVTNDAPAVFPLGTTTVHWSGQDASGNTGSATQNVTVVDTTPPTIVAPSPILKECTSPLGTPVALGTPFTDDICWATLTVTNNAPALFPLGTTNVTWTAKDGSNNSSSAGQLVTIQDTTPPSLSVVLSPAVLWPPNHKMVDITATIVATDVCDASPQVKLLAITSNEPDNGQGDGNTTGDIQGAAYGTDDRHFQLRAERSGNGNGRIYTVTYEARDASNNVAVRQAIVTVPHNQ
jgi:hypothetical protein